MWRQRRLRQEIKVKVTFPLVPHQATNKARQIPPERLSRKKTTPKHETTAHINVSVVHDTKLLGLSEGTVEPAPGRMGLGRQVGVGLITPRIWVWKLQSVDPQRRVGIVESVAVYREQLLNDRQEDNLATTEQAPRQIQVGCLRARGTNRK